ncbi:ABC transporter ATP-binding protein [Marinilabilia rubra]|uniref:Antibiotic ABC transporter ATP-binding protein n=1 Tax=Marinilabilia rubra TaxID=2162893 RepID=A0A2U2B3H8_9BACT|nr:ABC transporter ATP-binding protein [Marinilabilia rubra]PWD97623.1 antibiotic ABC transporter ATP-binding protein [Marinilabilia rubra]
MKDFFAIMRRFLPPYKHLLGFNFLFNLLSALFAVFSVALMVPMLEIILSQDSEVHELAAWSFNFSDLKQNLYYYITQLKSSYGPGLSLLFVGIFLVLGTFLKTGFAYLASYTSIGIRNGVVRDLRHQIYQKILQLPIGFFSEEKKGDIIARSTGDVQEVENSIMSSLDMFLKNPVLILVFLVAMLLFSVQLTLFVFVVLPVAGFIIGRIGKSLKKTSREGQNKMGDLLGIIEETLSGLRIVKAFNAEKRMDERFEGEVEDYKSIMNRLMRRRDLAHPMSEFLGTIVVVILVWFGGTLILTGTDTINAAEFLGYLAIFYQIINPAKAFSKATYNIQKGLAAYDRIDDILSANIAIEETENAKSIDSLKQGIEYRNVTFAYQETPVLRNVSVNIPKGRTIALVGQSGSGKSTFVDLLPRFYDVKEGAILIDGIDVKDLKIHDLRNLMGNVNQDAILFNDTIYNNIAFGVDDATPEKVEEAARVANAHEFISSFTHGYNTLVGDRGGRLSGGQRQRISIARAVLKNPPVLILDEATSALDTESEKLVQEALEKLMANRTSIVIAHRLSTVRNADRIHVFQDGEIVETGTHDELVEKGGVYQKLNELQMR